MIRESVPLHHSKAVPKMGNFLKITHVQNAGIAFGIRVKYPWIFTILSLLATIGIMVYLFLNWKENLWLKISLVLILGGAVGNLYDRIKYQRVVDFIDVGIGRHRWPTFNIVDSAVVIGMILLFIIVFLRDRQTQLSQGDLNKAE